MGLIECGRCGSKTNTTLCDWVNCIDTGKAARCYAKWNDEKEGWVEGCAMKDVDADSFMMNFAKKIIRNQAQKGTQ